MEKCPKCGHNEGDDFERPALLPVPNGFNDKCFMMLKGELKDHERKFITECQKRTELSEKQMKWWSAIHKNCFGSWPSKDAAVAAEPRVRDAQAWDETLKSTF